MGSRLNLEMDQHYYMFSRLDIGRTRADIWLFKLEPILKDFRREIIS